MAENIHEKIMIAPILRGDYDYIAEGLSQVNHQDTFAKHKPAAQYILYSTKINTDSLREQLNNITALFQQGSDADKSKSLIDNMYNTLSKTNSNKFFTGSIAKQKIEDMEAIKKDIQLLTDCFTTNLTADSIMSIANQYNEKIDTLKRDIRRELLEAAIRAFNNDIRIEYSEFPKKQEFTYVQENGVIRRGEINNPSKLYKNDESCKYEWDFLSSSPNGAPSISTTSPTVQIQSITDTYLIHKYKQIKPATNLCKSIQSPFDPTFAEIEKSFDEIGLSDYLPYSRKILEECGKWELEDNNTWEGR